MMSSSEDGAQAPKRRRTSRKLVEAIFQDTVSLAEMHADVIKITEITSDNRFTIQKENREISTISFDCPWCVEMGVRPQNRYRMRNMCKEDDNARRRLMDHMRSTHPNDLDRYGIIVPHNNEERNDSIGLEEYTQTNLGCYAFKPNMEDSSEEEETITDEQQIDAYFQVRILDSIFVIFFFLKDL